VCYNGPGEIMWQEFEGRKKPTNGQYQISLSKVIKLGGTISSEDRIERIK